jgi:hypothetical protein
VGAVVLGHPYRVMRGEPSGQRIYRKPLKPERGDPGVILRAERKRYERSRSRGLRGDPAADGGDA